MIYVKNLPVWERGLRLGIGVAVAIYGFIEPGRPWGWIELGSKKWTPST